MSEIVGKIRDFLRGKESRKSVRSSKEALKLFALKAFADLSWSKVPL